MSQSNEPTVDEKNLTIAEFMNLEKDHHSYLTGGRFRTAYLVNGYWLPLRKLKYHTSWDALIPVWDKLRTALFQCIPASGFNEGFDRFTLAWKAACFNAEIDKAHEVIFDAIQWLNQQKQTNEQ